ncbi:MAG: SMC family ATPase [Gammaproteobacteria bacterium]|nr:SMC family ATPase [Gammaproteobacteria bacterium]MDE0259194.1 SMC family ATPase [Gammaproteobacteria bacterium]
MRPLRLELEGFTCYREATVVDFADTDLLVFRGTTGSGKSSLIDAMIFALYGSVPRYDNLNLIAPVISQGKNRARVRLDFEARGRTYTAVRVVQRTRTGATTKEARLEAFTEGEPVTTLAATEADLSASVQHDVIGLSLDHFTKCVVLPQGDFAAFLRARPAERKQLLERLLGLGLYERLRKAANLRWKEEESRADNLKWQLESALAHATPEAVGAAERRIATLVQLWEHIGKVSAELARLASAAEAAGDRWTKAAGRLELLAEVRVPEQAAILATQYRQAEEGLRAASEALERAVDRRRGAQAALADLPQRAAIENVVKTRKELAGMQAEIGRTRDALNAAAEAAASAARHEKSANEELAEARRSLDGLPGKDELEAFRRQHDQLVGLEGEAERARGALSNAEREYRVAVGRMAEADHELDVATRVLDELRLAHGAADMAHHLTEGEPCPVCLQTVSQLPEHDVPADLDGARERKSAAEAGSKRARDARDGRAATRTSCVTAFELRQQSVAALREQLAGKPTPGQIDAELIRISEAEASVRLLEEQAGAAARERAGCEARLNGASATLRQQKRFAESLRADLTEAPTPEETAELLERIGAAEAALRQAQADEDAARRTHGDAEQKLKGLQARIAEAWTRFRSVRDGVAEMQPPPAAEGDLSGSWTRLSEWADGQYATSRETMAKAESEHERATRDKTRLDSKLRERCLRDGLAVGPDEDPAQQCSEELGAARARLEQLRESAAERKRVVSEEKDVRKRAVIAKDLGTHLSARSFGAWMQNQILAWLVEGATTRLRELSSGHYSLDLSDRNEFLVIDHRNADEPRLAKTLSGGETFLASLALALSLAEQVTNLAAHGSAKLEALFLDEGFGTLDSETLDVVAATIEQLGTERMVGIVTHVPELADRIPVQYRVKKVGNSSSVERVET